MRPNFPMISAATPATAGEAMLVPAAQQYVALLAPLPRHGAMTRSNTQQNCTIEPLGLRGSAHTALPDQPEAWWKEIVAFWKSAP